MRGRYKAAFLIPVGATKILGEYGWEFKGNGRLSKIVGESLSKMFNLEFFNAYSGIEKYVGGDVEMSIFFDDDGAVEFIYFQLFNESLSAFLEGCKASGHLAEVEIFVP